MSSVNWETIRNSLYSGMTADTQGFVITTFQDDYDFAGYGFQIHVEDSGAEDYLIDLSAYDSSKEMLLVLRTLATPGVGDVIVRLLAGPTVTAEGTDLTSTIYKTNQLSTDTPVFPSDIKIYSGPTTTDDGTQVDFAKAGFLSAGASLNASFLCGGNKYLAKFDGGHLFTAKLFPGVTV